MYEVEIEPSVLRAMRRLPRSDQRRRSERIDGLSREPRPTGGEKLTGLDAYRMRSGDYRIVYVIDDARRLVTVTRVGHRRDVYRGM